MLKIESPCLNKFLCQYDAKNIVKQKTCFKSTDNPSCIDLFLSNSYRSNKPLKPEIFHTLKATQTKSFQAVNVNIKDFSIAIYLFCSKKCIGVSENG